VRIRFLHAVDLVQDPWHSAARSGDGVLRITGTNVLIDAAALRADPLAHIITDEPQAVCRILGIPFPDMQVIEERK
jgi:hypothetical protein